MKLVYRFGDATQTQQTISSVLFAYTVRVAGASAEMQTPLLCRGYINLSSTLKTLFTDETLFPDTAFIPCL